MPQSDGALGHFRVYAEFPRFFSTLPAFVQSFKHAGMTSFWLILGALLIGIPGAAFVVLFLINQHKRQVMAYEWSAQEVVRRGQRLDEMERLTKGAQQKITELSRQKTELEAQVAKLEKMAAEAVAKETNTKTFSVGLYNQEVRRAHMMGEKHRQLDDKWGEINYVELQATSDDEVRRVIMRKFPPERGFVIESVQEVKQKYDNNEKKAR